MKTNGTYTDGNGYTEDEWERMWNSETATSTVHRASDDDEEAWTEVFDAAIRAGASHDEATDKADAEIYG